MKRRRGGLSAEDRDLWSRYSRTTEPLHPIAHTPTAGRVPLHRPKKPESGIAVPPFEIGQAARDRRPGQALAPTLREQVAGVPLRMDAKMHRRMRSGKLRPEAKIDLHGMTLDVAHPELTRFVLGAQAAGKRLILVVTGKGKHRPGDGPIPNRLGVLKHQVPQWLRTPPLVGLVLQVTEAHRTHGGSGAYYVYLRR